MSYSFELILFLEGEILQSNPHLYHANEISTQSNTKPRKNELKKKFMNADKLQIDVVYETSILCKNILHLFLSCYCQH